MELNHAAASHLVPSPPQKDRGVCWPATTGKPTELPGSEVSSADMTVAVNSCWAEAASEGASLTAEMLARDSHLAVGSQCRTSWPVSGCGCTLPITWEAPPAALNSPSQRKVARLLGTPIWLLQASAGPIAPSVGACVPCKSRGRHHLRHIWISESGVGVMVARDSHLAVGSQCRTS